MRRLRIYTMESHIAPHLDNNRQREYHIGCSYLWYRVTILRFKTSSASTEALRRWHTWLFRNRFDGRASRQSGIGTGLACLILGWNVLLLASTRCDMDVGFLPLLVVR